MFQFTPVQAQAAHGITVNQAVLAGAGAGKTRVLVERYLNLLTSSRRPLNSVVAVTFTEKAAAEMRVRVRDRLAGAVHDPTQTEAARARAADLLRQIDSARIATIHSLCGEILRACAAEAGIDPQFTILDEVSSAILFSSAIDDGLRAAQADGTLRRLVALGFTPEHIRAGLKNYGRQPLPALTSGLIGGPVTDAQQIAWQMETWARQWRDRAVPLLTAIVHSPELAAAFAEPDPVNPKKLLAEGWPSAKALLAELHALLRDSDPAPETLYALLRRGHKLKKQGTSKDTASDVIRQLIAWGTALAADPGDPPGSADRRAAEALLLWRALIERTAAAYAALKTARAALDFTDLEDATQQLLEGHHGRAVRERYRAEIAALLVDEFQDTSPAQWAIVRALADPAEPGRLFLVGDPKQSIYAFRGADVSVFAQARDAIAAADGQVLAFRASFRAHAPLVTGFNALFERILQPDGAPAHPFETVYTPTNDAMIAHAQHAPCADPPLEVLLVPAKGGDEASLIAARIAELVGVAPVRDRAGVRPCRCDDIAVLLPALTDKTLHPLEDALRRAGIPFVTTAGRGYFDRPEVTDLLHLLRALEAPSDDLALATALRSPLFSLSDDALLALRLPALDAGAQADPVPLWLALESAAGDPAALPWLPDAERGRVTFAYAALTRLRRLAGRVPIAEVLTAALEHTGYLAALEGLPRDGTRRRTNAEKLVELARTSGLVRLAAFNQYAEALSAAEAREGESPLDAAGAVRIMTIHKSKGLEFPIVFVACAHHTGRADTAPVRRDAALGLVCNGQDEAGKWIDGGAFAFRQVKALEAARTAAERKRLLYVGMTRAADRCIVTGRVTGVTQDKGEPKAGGMLGGLLAVLPALTGAVIAPGTVTLTGRTDDEAVWTARLDLLTEPVTLPLRSPPPPPAVPVTPHTVDPYPGLLRPLDLPPSAVRTITATLAADLGALAHAEPGQQSAHRLRARRRLLDDAPHHIRRATPEVTRTDPTPRLIGELVHQALRWRDGWSRDYADRRRTLEHFAWENGITDDALRSRVLDEAIRLLQRELTSDVQQWVSAARRVFRETPFAYRAEGRIIHGVIDLLVQHPDGTWALIDYKTACVARHPSAAQLTAHARRYALQMGVYAAAARDLLATTALTPPVLTAHLRYIRHNQTIALDLALCAAEVAALETRIGAVVDNERRADS